MLGGECVFFLYLLMQMKAAECESELVELGYGVAITCCCHCLADGHEKS